MFANTKYIPVGLYEDFEYGESLIRFEPGDKIFLYTDGVTEAENAESTLFGDNHMLQIIKDNLQASPRELVHLMEVALAEHVRGFTQSDDITMMTILHH